MGKMKDPNVMIAEAHKKINKLARKSTKDVFDIVVLELCSCGKVLEIFNTIKDPEDDMGKHIVLTDINETFASI